MKFIVFSFWICLVAELNIANAQPDQSYFDGKFKIVTRTFSGYKFTLYDFSREANTIKAKYFAQDAYSHYVNWRTGKQILLVTAGAFSDSWDANARPIGLCVDNGVIINRSINYTMDGMVIIYNGGIQQGGVAVVDMSMNPVNVQTTYGSGNTVSYWPKTSVRDRINFLKWGENQNATLFQTQLVFSSDKSSNFKNPFYGPKRERRFLATCKKNNIIHHIVIDAPDVLELNISARYAKNVLESNGFIVMYIMNLDTGDKNILFAYMGNSLRNQLPYVGQHPERAIISKATNLLIYYRD